MSEATSQRNSATAHKWKRYPKYKDSGVEWLGEVPEGWRVKKLHRVLHRVIHKNEDSTHRKMLSLSSYRGIVLKQYDSENLIRPKEESLNYSIVKPGQLVVNPMWVINSSIGVSNIDGIVSPAYRVYNITREFDRIYFHNLLKSPAYLTQYNRYIRGLTTYDRSVREEDFFEIEVLIPSLTEQTAMANFLDHETAYIDTLLSKKERQIELLNERRIALISQVVIKGLNPNVKMKDSGFDWIGKIPEHWKISKIKWISLKTGSGKTPRGGAEIYKESGIFFIRSQNVHFEGLKLEDVVFIDSQMDEEMKSTRVKENDVLLNITGASLGRCAWVSIKIDANVSQHVCIIRPMLGKINPQYLNDFLSSSVAQKQIFLSQDGVSREGLPLSGVGNIFILSPPLPEQQKIALYVEEKAAHINAVIEKVSHSINLLKEYRTTLISAAVTGKIDVRVEVR